ncbi:MAG: nucleoside-diphosphate sugar epimerase [Rubritepida sp.]|nr:nucleoside-diphosphate sugar epimerase [Rubritepida sp.]
MENKTLLVVGLGYSGSAIAALSAMAGARVIGTTRNLKGSPKPTGMELVSFDDVAPYALATHLLVTAPPDAKGDPVWAAHAQALKSASLHWVGYLSTTGVYGDRGGAWVEERTAPAPGQERSRRRLEAEQQWSAFGGTTAVDLFRTAGIYGLGRSAMDDVRAGTARQVRKPGHAFGRIHRDDIARAVLAAMAKSTPGIRVLHLVDDEPAESADVACEAARLMGTAPPPEAPFAEAWEQMSEMGRSFWSENRRIANTRTKTALGIDWAYPSYREGLRAILAEERAQRTTE